MTDYFDKSMQPARLSELYEAILAAFATGDAMGMPTEFMTRREIAQRIAGPNGLVSTFADPSLSRNHPNLAKAQVTDDTEQNLWLIGEYCSSGNVDARRTALTLVAWARETGAAEKRYIGPSSLKALKSIEDGMDPLLAGTGGTTCGGIMRTLSATLCAISGGWDLQESVIRCCVPTHNTSVALEAAMAYAFAMRAAVAQMTTDQILDEAVAGCRAGMRAAPAEFCAASTASRITYLRNHIGDFSSPDELLDFLYGTFGTGLESFDVAAATFGIFLFSRDDPWLAIRMGASAGGDTDTIAALSGALCAAHAGSHNIPAPLVADVCRVNSIDFKAVARTIAELDPHARH